MWHIVARRFVAASLSEETNKPTQVGLYFCNVKGVFQNITLRKAIHNILLWEEITRQIKRSLFTCLHYLIFLTIEECDILSHLKKRPNTVQKLRYLRQLNEQYI